MPVAAPTRPVSEIISDPRSRELRRDFTVERSAINESARTVDLSFASEEPVERWFGDEILNCTADAVDFNRLNNGGALLVNHNPDDQIGVVTGTRIDGGKCRATVRFSRSARAQEIFQDVCDGIRSLVSVGYRVKSMVLAEQRDTEGDTYRVDAWEPYEVSLVSIPADSSVGVGRSQPEITSPAATRAGSTIQSLPSVMETTSAAPAAPVLETRERPAAAALPESTRMSEIRAIGEKVGVPQERIIKALAENESLDSFRSWVIENHLKSEPVKGPPTIGMTHKEKRRYSLTRAVNRIAAREALDGFEREVSDECAKKFRRETPAAGFLVPHDVAEFNDREMIAAMLRVNPSLAGTRHGQQMQRALQANVFTGAGALVGTELLGGSLIELLRNKTLLTQLGVGTMSGLQGNIAIPRQTGAATAYWLAEGDSVTASQQAVAQVGATPRKLAAQTGYNKQLLAQSSIDTEAFVRDDLMRVLAIAKDLAGIAGTGGAQPLGILNGPTSNASSENLLQTVTYSAAATWAKQLSFETNIMTQNADIGSINWLTNITSRNAWKQIAKIGSTYPVFLCDDENRCNGYPVNVTNQIGTSGTYANRAILGAWSQALFCDWAGMDVVVDPYTQAASGQVIVTLSMWTDFIVRHWPSFCVSTDSAAQ